MELSQEFLIDMAINAGGYLLSGIISIIFYKIFLRKKTVVIEEIVEEIKIQKEIINKNFQPAINQNKKIEFIRFGKEQNIQNINNKPIKREEPQIENNGRMNRKEAINLAKKMLLAGATQEKIKKILPVSDSELALLNLNLK